MAKVKANKTNNNKTLTIANSGEEAEQEKLPFISDSREKCHCQLKK